jgi:16S rRNA (uracil1498-N3)-methyltransferase
VLVDPWRGVEASAELLGASNKEALARVGPLRAGTRLGHAPLHLVQGLGKGDKIERVLRDAVALGAGKIWIVKSERSVPDGTHSTEKQARWLSIALDAVRQCERADLPPVCGPLSGEQVLEQTPEALRLILHPSPSAQPLLQLLRERWAAEPAARPLQLWVGPEGGFAPSELARLEAQGALFASLGELILRTELAASVALALAGSHLREQA